MGAPQIDFIEGPFIDYRSFEAQNITPIYEFGFGLSYTTFSYSNLQIYKINARTYTPTTGLTSAAPVLGNFSTNLSDYLFPNGRFPHIWQYIYPYLNTTDAKAASTDPYYGQTAAEFLPSNATNGSPQPLLAAGGAPGGNPELWDVLYTVTATITNNGTLDGEEVPQLYVSLGGPNNPRLVLRGFDRLSINAGQSATFTADILRRDLSNWDTVSQNWVITSYPKTVYIGSSSRNLPLSQTLS
jgi:beta-glucosidase